MQTMTNISAAEPQIAEANCRHVTGLSFKQSERCRRLRKLGRSGSGSEVGGETSLHSSRGTLHSAYVGSWGCDRSGVISVVLWSAFELWRLCMAF